MPGAYSEALRGAHQALTAAANIFHVAAGDADDPAVLALAAEAAAQAAGQAHRAAGAPAAATSLDAALDAVTRTAQTLTQAAAAFSDVQNATLAASGLNPATTVTALTNAATALATARESVALGAEVADMPPVLSHGLIGGYLSADPRRLGEFTTSADQGLGEVLDKIQSGLISWDGLTTLRQEVSQAKGIPPEVEAEVTKRIGKDSDNNEARVVFSQPELDAVLAQGDRALPRPDARIIIAANLTTLSPANPRAVFEIRDCTVTTVTGGRVYVSAGGTITTVTAGTVGVYAGGTVTTVTGGWVYVYAGGRITNPDTGNATVTRE